MPSNLLPSPIGLISSEQKNERKRLPLDQGLSAASDPLPVGLGKAYQSQSSGVSRNSEGENPGSNLREAFSSHASQFRCRHPPARRIFPLPVARRNQPGKARIGLRRCQEP